VESTYQGRKTQEASQRQAGLCQGWGESEGRSSEWMGLSWSGPGGIDLFRADTRSLLPSAPGGRRDDKAAQHSQQAHRDTGPGWRLKKAENEIVSSRESLDREWPRGASPGLMGSGWFAGFWKRGEREEPRARDENKT
jgi:hypothetical protein